MDAAEIFRQETRDVYAEAALETCMNEGALIEYQDTAYTCRLILWAAPGEEQRTLAMSGPISEEQTSRTFFIPRQPAWMDWDCADWIDPEDRQHFPPPNRPATNAIIHYQGFAWAVKSWEMDAVEAGFTATAIRHQPRRVDDEEAA